MMIQNKVYTMKNYHLLIISNAHLLKMDLLLELFLELLLNLDNILGKMVSLDEE